MLPILFELLQVATLSRQLPGSGSDAVNGVYVDHDYVLVSLFTMSIPFSGRVTRSGGLMSAIGKQLKSLNLKPVKRIDFRFDPFHEKVTPARKFLSYLHGPKIVSTNPHCLVKTEVVCDRSEPTVTISLQSGEKVLLKTTNLSVLNILQLYNKHVSSLVPPSQAALEAKEAFLEKKRKRKRPPKIREGSKHRGVRL